MNNYTSEKKPADFILLHPSRGKWDLLAIAVFLVTLVVYRFQALLHLNTHVLGGTSGDANLYLWLVRSNTRDLFSLAWFNTKAFYPYSQSLAWSDSFILPSLILWPFLKLGVPLITAFNGLILVATFLNGFCTYKLSVRLTGKELPALVAGLGFMTWPFLTEHLGHTQLQFAFWIPLSLSLLFTYFSKPRMIIASLLGLTITLCFLCVVYYALFIILALAVSISTILVLRPKFSKNLKPVTFSVGFLLGILPLGLFLSPYFGTKETFGGRGMYEAYYFSASAISFLSSTANSLLYRFSSSWSIPEAQLFPGLAILILALPSLSRLWSAKPLKNLLRLGLLIFALSCACSVPGLPSPTYKYFAALGLWVVLVIMAILTYRMGLLERKLGFSIMTNRGLTAIFLAIALVFFTLALGPLGNPEKHQYALGLYSALYYTIPGFDALRAIGRAGVISIFALHMVAAFTLATLTEKSSLARPIIFITLCLVLIENFSLHYPLEQQKERPLVFDYLANQYPDKQAAMVVLPLAASLNPDGSVKSWSNYAQYNTEYMHWAFDTEFNLINGYSGQRSKLMKEFPAQTIGFPDQRSSTALRSVVGLRYVVYISKNDPSFDREQFEHRAQQQIGNFNLVMVDDSGNYLFELTGQSRIKLDSYLLVPSYPDGRIYLELMTQYQKDAQEVVVDIFTPDILGSSPLASATLKATGQWEMFLVETSKLPKGRNKTRPVVLALRSHDESTIYLRQTKFED